MDLGIEANEEVLNLCYNLADAINKIGFGLVIYSLAISSEKEAA
jgi:hypothetical protein